MISSLFLKYNFLQLEYKIFRNLEIAAFRITNERWCSSLVTVRIFSFDFPHKFLPLSALKAPGDAKELLALSPLPLEPPWVTRSHLKSPWVSFGVTRSHQESPGVSLGVTWSLTTRKYWDFEYLLGSYQTQICKYMPRIWESLYCTNCGKN